MYANLYLYGWKNHFCLLCLTEKKGRREVGYCPKGRQVYSSLYFCLPELKGVFSDLPGQVTLPACVGYIAVLRR